jgi:Tetracyclin repressor-like, C-terminal domain
MTYRPAASRRRRSPGEGPADPSSTPVRPPVSLDTPPRTSLPPARFPNTVALVDGLMSGGPDERFEFGLDVLVRGLAAQREADGRLEGLRRLPASGFA